MKTYSGISPWFFAVIGLFSSFAQTAFCSPTLIDVEFNGGNVPRAVGLAATGLTSADYWNFYSNVVALGGPVSSSGIMTNLDFVNGVASGVGLAVTNAMGGYGIYTSSVTNGMMTNYVYAVGGYISLTITNLSAGLYDFYLYGHGNVDNQNSAFQLSVGGVNQGTEATTTTAGWNSTVWQEGMQYVEFTNVAVAAGQAITIQVESGASMYAPLNGLQIEPVSATTPEVWAASQSVSVTENMSLAVTLGGSSSDGGALAYTVVNQPANGTLTGTAPNLTYHPGANFTGFDDFTFQVSEGQITSAVSTVSIAVLPAGSGSVSLIDVEFNGGNVPRAVGLAATGLTPADYWNFYSNVVALGGPVSSSGIMTNLDFVNGVASGVGLAVTNATGSYGIYTSSVTNGMMTNYVYAAGGNISLTITNLSAGLYDFYLYGHGNVNNQNSVFQLSVGGVSQGTEPTTTTAGWNSTVWQEGMQYVEFTNVAVAAGLAITIQVEPGGSSYAPLNGMQITSLPTSGAPVVIQSPASQAANSGATVSFSARAAGSPSTIQWYLTNTLGVNPVSGGTSSPLVLTANDGSAGGYMAVFSNSFGMATTAMAVLTVIDLPVIATSPVSQTANAGDLVTFTASIAGGSASVQWYLVNYLGTNAISGANSPTLTVTANGPTAGIYFAVFHNSLGSAATGAANLGVLNLPFVNGSFEINTNGAVFAAGSTTLINVGATWMEGWTVGGPGNDVYVLDGLVDGLSPYQGQQYMNFHAYNNPAGGNLAQTFTTTVGQTYEITFQVGELGTGIQSITAKAFASGGALLASNYCVPTSVQWTQFQLIFNAVSTNTTLFFLDSSTLTSTANVTLDGVTVVSAPTSGAPVVIQSPASKTASSGAQVSFSALAGGSPSAMQWYLTNALGVNPVSGGTNSPLAVTANDGSAGGYTAVFSNSFGMATTAMAVLTVIDPPVIATSPVSQTANAGDQVTFTASITGSPAGVQWYLINYLGTNAISGATSPTLTVTAGGPAAGSYFAVFSNSAGSAATGAAILGVLNLPFVNGSFEINTNGAVFAAGSTTLINVGATWMDGWTVGGPGNDVYVLDGLVDGLSPYQGQQYMNFHALNTRAGGNLAQTFTTTVGQPYVVTFQVGELGTGVQSITAKAFASSGALLASNYCVPTSVKWTQFQLSFTPASTNTTLFFLDSSTLTSTANVTLDAVTALAPPVIVTSPAGLTVTNGNTVTFTASAGGTPSAVQWYQGTNLISGATNATLTFVANAGSGGYYTAVFSNAAGSAATTPALLTVANPVFFTQQPQSVTTDLGANVTYAGAASGDTPILFQWQFDGTNIADATNASLVLNNVQITNAGSYVLLATNASGWAASSNAVLSIVSTLQVVSSTGSGAGTVTVPVDFVATGNESVASFSLDFDPRVLTFVGMTPGRGSAGATFIPNTNQVASGQIGLLVGYIGGNFSPGVQEIADVTFSAILATNSVTTTVGFGGSPTLQRVIDASFDQLPVNYLAGTVTVTPTSLEGDVWPRPNGGYGIDVNDWQQEARFVVGLDTVSNALEFQRADCAPRSTSGDGVIDALDLVQVGRYVVGLDSPTPIGGPTGPAPEFRLAKSGTIHPLDSASDRTLSLVPMTNVPNAVMVQLLAAGDEGALVFSVSFDPSIVSFVSATKAAGIAAFAVNSNNAATGSLGIAASRSSFAAGTNPIAQLVFSPVTYSNTATLSFADVPANRSVSDVTGTTHLLATYQNGALAVSGSSWPMLSLSSTSSQITLSWPSSATNFVVQTTTNFSSAWAAAGGSPVSNGSTISLTLPAPANTAFYRLSQQP